MKLYGLLGTAFFGAMLLSGTVGQSAAMPVAKNIGAASHNSVIDVRAGRGGGGRAGVARAGGGRATVSRGSVSRAGGRVNRANVTARRNTSVNVNRRTNVNVNRTNVNVVRRPVRGWVARPYYGTIIGGVALGTMIAVTAGAAPVAPAPDLCWFWSDSAQVQGYWDYCAAR